MRPRACGVSFAPFRLKLSSIQVMKAHASVRPQAEAATVMLSQLVEPPIAFLLWLRWICWVALRCSVALHRFQFCTYADRAR